MKTLRWFGIALVVGLLSFGAAKWWTVRQLVRADVHMTPFTVEQISYNSKGQAVEDRTTYFRSDGSRTMFGHFPQHPEKGRLRKTEYADGRVMTVFEFYSLKMSGRNPAQMVADRRALLEHPPASCLKTGETEAGSERLAGVPVTKFTWQQDAPPVAGPLGPPAPGAVIETTQWRALSLRCYPLETVTTLRRLDGTEASISTKPVFVVMGEPKATAFADSEDAREMKPSDLLNELSERTGKPSTDLERRQAEAQDAVYEQMQNAK